MPSTHPTSSTNNQDGESGSMPEGIHGGIFAQQGKKRQSKRVQYQDRGCWTKAGGRGGRNLNKVHPRNCELLYYDHLTVLN